MRKQGECVSGGQAFVPRSWGRAAAAGCRGALQCGTPAVIWWPRRGSVGQNTSTLLVYLFPLNILALHNSKPEIQMQVFSYCFANALCKDLSAS